MKIDFHIKRLYSYILRAFLPLFLMTFAICVFLVLMQLLWKYVEDLVGKGLSLDVLGEMLWYAILMSVSQALPLSILLASLMIFGNMGEDLELLAVKAAGISLLKTMAPLIVLISFISVIAFFYENNAMPRIQTKFYSLMISIKQKSPEVDIPENVFYKDIGDYNLFVEKKNRKTGMLYNVLLYDTSNGFNDMTVIICDSAKMSTTEDKLAIVFTMYHGQQFSNFQQGQTNARNSPDFVPYGRENFEKKMMIAPFDANFNRLNESTLEDNASSGYVSRNLNQLMVSIDSMTYKLDSVNLVDRKRMKETTYFAFRNSYGEERRDSMIRLGQEITTVNFDSLMASKDIQAQSYIYQNALSKAESNNNDFMFRALTKSSTQKTINRYWIEWHKKFTVPFACLVFFFIGAPLGSIVRKGGLGMPIVISLVLFIIYYILDNIGYKMARDGVWIHWVGRWFSSMILLPLGIFLTYKAINDSSIMNADTYIRILKKALFIREKRNYPRKDVIIDEPNYEQVFAMAGELTEKVNKYLNDYSTIGYKTYWTEKRYDKKLSKINVALETMLNVLSNSRDGRILYVAEQYPILIKNVRPFKAGSKMAKTMMYLFPLGMAMKLISVLFEKRIDTDLQSVKRLNTELVLTLEKYHSTELVQ